MNSLFSAISKNLSNGELAAHIAEALGDKKLKSKINKAIATFFEGETVDKKEKVVAKKGKASKKEEKKSFDKMTVAELKEELKALKLDTKGKKADLIARLKGDEVSGSDSEEEKPKASKKAAAKKTDKKKVVKDSDDEEEKVEYKKMKVGELRELLKERGLDSKGKKDELVERLENAGEKEDEANSDDEKDSDEEEGVSEIDSEDETGEDSE